MPPRPPLPRLTLYTGGKECSLCEVAKIELAKVRQVRPFDLKLFNIRSPPADVDAREAKRWRRLYQYDIDPEAPYQRSGPRRGFGPMADRARSPAPTSSTLGDSRSSRYEPYKSVIKHVEAHRAPPAEPRRARPPWREKVGEAWLSLDSQYGASRGEHIPKDEEDGFSDIVARAFANFAGKEEWVVRIDDGQDEPLEVALDVDPERGIVGGDTSVMYAREEAATSLTPRSKTSRSSRACWNCLEVGHILADCPYPRDHLQIRASRDAFTAQKDAMPDFAQPYLAAYTFTEEERDRRLALVSRFAPGVISEELKDALFWVDEEDEDLGEGIFVNPRGRGGREELMEESAATKRMRLGMMAVRRKRGDWPWFEWMLKWGYPPGWVAGRNPMDEVRRRLEIKEIETDIPDSASEDDLEVFGEQHEVAPLPESRSSRRLLREGSADMILLSPTPSPPPSPPPPPHHPPPPEHSPPPPPPSQPPPPSPDSSINQANPQQYPAPRRWVDYHTQQFDSERLMAYSETRPLPLGY